MYLKELSLYHVIIKIKYFDQLDDTSLTSISDYNTVFIYTASRIINQGSNVTSITQKLTTQ